MGSYNNMKDVCTHQAGLIWSDKPALIQILSIWLETVRKIYLF